ncbi:MAG UNVERIFIED_CONTAM: hypothetical protein LVT10_27300 [Anaerolineae bacterium]
MQNLRSNRLRTLPRELAQLPHLEKLDVRWNHALDVLPAWLADAQARGCVIYPFLS